MAKKKSHYTCQSCGSQSPRWVGRCSGCGEWNTLVEELAETPVEQSSLSTLRDEFRWLPSQGEAIEALDASQDQIEESERLTTGISELDRVLGGGLVPDSFILLGGDPGIGKSTLLLQVIRGLVESDSQNHKKLKVLYVSGEESKNQIRARAQRLGVSGHDQVFLGAETQIEKVFESVKQLQPDILMMDSLQTFSSGVLQSAPGSVSQVREVSARLMTLAKTAGIAIFLVGHVTKEGSIAGPKVVEHMVDTVLYFEGEGAQNFRLLRAVKNRFGSVRELGVFEMSSQGLEQVTNPSSLFMSDREQPIEGTALGSTLEGTRPLMLELQALVAPSPLSLPRRTASGMDSTRISLLAAVIEKHMKLTLGDHDLFFNVAGGLRVSDPACDLAAIASIYSSTKGSPIDSHTLFIGEVGLTGEVRRVSHADIRIEEAQKLGIQRIFLSRSDYQKFHSEFDVELISVGTVTELENLL